MDCLRVVVWVLWNYGLAAVCAPERLQGGYLVHIVGWSEVCDVLYGYLLCLVPVVDHVQELCEPFFVEIGHPPDVNAKSHWAFVG